MAKRKSPGIFAKRKRKAILLGAALVAAKGALSGAAGVAAKAVAAKAGLGLLLNPPYPPWLVQARAKYHSWLEGVGGKARSYSVTLYRGGSESRGPSFSSRKLAEMFMADKQTAGFGTSLWMMTTTPQGLLRVQYPSLFNTHHFSALVTPPASAARRFAMSTANPCGSRRRNPAEVDKIIAYEQGELSGRDTIRLFASLIKSGTVWELQGHYGRTAKQLIEAGYISTKGQVLRQVEENDGEALVAAAPAVKAPAPAAPAAAKANPLLMVVPNPGGKQLYVGMKRGLEPPGEVFRSARTPTAASHSKRYDYVVGPFRTVFAAELMAQFGGQGNPHYQHVSDAEAYATAYRKRGLTTVVQVLRSPSPHANPSKARANPMKVHKELFDRWHKYVHLLLSEKNVKLSDVTSPVAAWNIAHRLDIPREAYHVGLNDSHIETALRKLFPFAWARKNPGSLVEAEVLRRADAARDAKQAALHSRYMKAIDADDRAEMARISEERASVGGAPQSRRVKMIRIKPGQWGEAVMPYSEVNMHMRIAGKWMRFVLLKDKKWPMVQLLKPDGNLFSAPITPGEAGIMEDAKGYYYRPYTTPLSNPASRSVLRRAGPGRVRSNPGDDMGSLTKNPEFKKAVALYRKFHGCDPKSFKRVLLPTGSKNKVDGRGFFVSLGKAPAESYTPPARSKKAGSIYVHKYEGAPPEKVVSADGKLVVTLPGKHRVTDWIRG